MPTSGVDNSSAARLLVSLASTSTSTMAAATTDPANRARLYPEYTEEHYDLDHTVHLWAYDGILHDEARDSPRRLRGHTYERQSLVVLLGSAGNETFVRDPTPAGHGAFIPVLEVQNAIQSPFDEESRRLYDLILSEYDARVDARAEFEQIIEDRQNLGAGNPVRHREGSPFEGRSDTQTPTLAPAAIDVHVHENDDDLPVLRFMTFTRPSVQGPHEPTNNRRRPTARNAGNNRRSGGGSHVSIEADLRDLYAAVASQRGTLHGCSNCNSPCQKSCMVRAVVNQENVMICFRCAFVVTTVFGMWAGLGRPIQHNPVRRRTEHECFNCNRPRHTSSFVRVVVDQEHLLMICFHCLQEKATAIGSWAPAHRFGASNAPGSQPGQHEPRASEPAATVPYVSVTPVVCIRCFLPF